MLKAYCMLERVRLDVIVGILLKYRPCEMLLYLVRLKSAYSYYERQMLCRNIDICSKMQMSGFLLGIYSATLKRSQILHIETIMTCIANLIANV